MTDQSPQVHGIELPPKKQASLSLLPAPQELVFLPGSYCLQEGRLIQLLADTPQKLFFDASRFKHHLQTQLGLCWEISAGPATPTDLTGLQLVVSTHRSIPDQGYELAISLEGIDIQASSEAGIFYGICTLVQIIEQSGACLPCLSIRDWPDLPARGVMLDVSRDKVPTMQTLFDLVDRLASWKYNQLQLYTEHTFAYRRHSAVWAQSSPITGEEILALDAYCRQRHIALVPNQNSFGHMHRWLKHPAYAHLAEVQDGFDTAWGRMEGSFSLCPLDPGSLELLAGLYDELLPHFSSKMFNVGLDETFDLGQGRSKDACIQRGAGPVYLDFLLEIYRRLKERGYTMQFWGDVILGHPELIESIPKDVIALDWGYEADHPFDAQTAQFATAGIPFYVCPGTSSWCSLAGRTDNALANLYNAAKYGLQNGAIGYLVTDWGDNGHWQSLPISYLGFVAGAAYSWSLRTNTNLNIPKALDLHAFKDRSGILGNLAFQLGNVNRETGVEFINSSVLFKIMQRSLEVLRAKEYIRSIPYQSVMDTIASAIAPLSNAGPQTSDRDLVIREFELTARLLRHACLRGEIAVADIPAAELARRLCSLDRDLGEIIDVYQAAWLARNRPGGLQDSLARFEKARQDYEQSAAPDAQQIAQPVA